MLQLQLEGVEESFDPDGSPTGGHGLSRRRYASYEAYLNHQRSKLAMIQSGSSFGLDGTDLNHYDRTFRASLRDRIKALGLAPSGSGVLCIAARLGTEVKAFLDCGCFAIGVDLNPGANNPFVLPGDFHHLVFADGSLDVVYCNSLDHAYDLKALFAEIRRILKPGGRFIAELQLGSVESQRQNTGRWESLEWESTEVVVRELAGAGLAIDQSSTFNEPWPGRCLVLTKTTSTPGLPPSMGAEAGK